MKTSIKLVKALIFIATLIDVAGWTLIELALLKWAYVALGSIFIPATIVIGVIGLAILILIGVVSKKVYERFRFRRF